MRRLRRPLFGIYRRNPRDRRRAPRQTPDRRVNRVKFRRRYAAARLKAAGELFWIASRLAVVSAVLVWAGGMAWHGYRQSEFLKVQGVRYDGDIPARLPATIPIKTGIGLFTFDADKIEREAEKRFVELRDVTVGRSLDRHVVVRGRFRTPVAILESAQVPTGIDAFGIAFPIPPGRAPVKDLPVIDAPARERANAVACLSAWERKLPAFFDVVKKLECDRMRTFRVELSDGVIIEWGSLELPTAVEKASKVMRVMHSFSPDRSPARLKFVTEDRIVMDAAWRTASGTARQGGPIVKS
jgi:cell division septal protein FtsQ